MFEPPSLPPAGWYPDPTDPYHNPRWWDGNAWAPSSWDPVAPGEFPGVASLIGDSFRLMWRRWRALGILSALTTAPSVVLSAIALERATDDLRVIDDELVGWSNDRLSTVVPLVVVTAVLSLLASIAATRLMIDTVDEQPAESDFGSEATAAVRSIGAGIRVVPRLVGWMLVAGIAALLAFTVAIGLMLVSIPIGIIVLIALFPLAFWIGVKLAFVAVAIVDRRGNPFSRSWEVSSERFWATCGRLLAICGIAYAASTAANIPLSFSNSASFGTFGTESEWLNIDEAGNVDSVDFGSLFDVTWWALVLAAIIAIAINVVVSGFTYAALTSMYRTRNERQI